MKLQFDLNETRELTKKVFNLTDSEVDYITEDFLNGDFNEFDSSFEFSVDSSIDEGKTITYWYGHNVAYGRANNGRFVYVFLSGPNNGCETQRYVFYQDQWNHYSTGNFCRGIQDERHRVIRFERR